MKNTAHAFAKTICLLLRTLLIVIVPFIGPTVAFAKQDQVPGDGQVSANISLVVDQVIKAVRQKDMAILEKYEPKGAVLSWWACNASDEEIQKMTFQKMRQHLNKMAHGDEIYVHPIPDVEDYVYEKNAKAITVYTDGWMSEYPYLNFLFVYKKDSAVWEWRGACDSDGPPFRLLKDGKYHEVYYREPVLPRRGPRVFKDYSALKARIKEIIHFRKFEALKSYAVRKPSLIFGECNQKMMEKDAPVGKVKAVDDIAKFLKKNGSGADEIKFSGVSHVTYYETVGWSGEYPIVAFWLTESKEGWELSGVSYCKTRHFDLFPPLYLPK